ncbi:tetratricopeptide repeat protein, partial [Streptomyces otsuchiensis]|uniref:tetratricopeptide repeat protein n=1 Tax=Streptomyces otsuchiensis TaxID=2681388 RepID=UPI001D1323BB
PCPDPAAHRATDRTPDGAPGPGDGSCDHVPGGTPGARRHDSPHRPEPEESDVLRRAFMTGGPAALAALTMPGVPAQAAAVPSARVGEREAEALEDTVRTIRLLDDQHGADGLYRRAGESLNSAHALLDIGAGRQEVSDRLHAGAGELALSVGWLAHDSGRFGEARSHYAEALATARMSNDAALEAHAFCNSAFLARDAGRPRESVRAAQAGRQAARRHPSHRLRSLLAMREAGGWAGLGDRAACLEALGHCREHFERGEHPDDPEWMTFFSEAELAGLEAQCWSALGDYPRAAECARLAVELQAPHFVRNTALFSAELAGDLAGCGRPEEAAATALRSLDLLGGVRSSRITGMLRDTAERLSPYRTEPEVGAFLSRTAAAR